MLQIYDPTKCPEWVKEKCKDITETKDGTRYTCYKPSKETIYYLVYSNISISTVLHICQQLEEQTLKKSDLV